MTVNQVLEIVLNVVLDIQEGNRTGCLDSDLCSTYYTK